MKLAWKGIFQTPITDFIYHQKRGHFISPRNRLVATINASSKSICSHNLENRNIYNIYIYIYIYEYIVFFISNYITRVAIRCIVCECNDFRQHRIDRWTVIRYSLYHGLQHILPCTIIRYISRSVAWAATHLALYYYSLYQPSRCMGCSTSSRVLLFVISADPLYGLQHI